MPEARPYSRVRSHSRFYTQARPANDDLAI